MRGDPAGFERSLPRSGESDHCPRTPGTGQTLQAPPRVSIDPSAVTARPASKLGKKFSTYLISESSSRAQELKHSEKNSALSSRLLDFQGSLARVTSMSCISHDFSRPGLSVSLGGLMGMKSGEGSPEMAGKRRKAMRGTSGLRGDRVLVLSPSRACFLPL